MFLLENAIRELLCEGAASVNDINDAIDQHRVVYIKYRSDGTDLAAGPRHIGVVAYGATKGGNDCIRAFEYRGDSLSKVVPGYKLFRLDRITAWKPLGVTFVVPPDNINEPFNPSGDKSMSVVYKVAKFDKRRMRGIRGDSTKTMTNPKTKQETEGGMPDSSTDSNDINLKTAEEPQTGGPKVVQKTPKEQGRDSYEVSVKDVRDTANKMRDTANDEELMEAIRRLAR